MLKNKTVYIIGANDAALHLGRIKEIFEGFKKEGRIADHVAWSSEKSTETSFHSVKSQDMIVLLLTEGIKSQKIELEQQMLQLKKDQPQTKIVEIIIDNLPYEKAFIPFPTNLQPIREHACLDTACEKIGNSLRNMLPMEKRLIPRGDHNKWSRNLKVAGVRLLLIGAFFILTGMVVKETDAHHNVIKECSSENMEIKVTGLDVNSPKVGLTSITPASPATLRTGEKVQFKFKYEVNEPGGVRIFGRPMTKGKVTTNYGAHGASVLPTGKGSGSGDFTIKSGNQVVDQIRIQIWNADQSKMLHEAFFPVNFRFTSDGSSTDSPTLSASDTRNLKVTDLTVSVSPNNFSGKCPKEINFTGKITVDKPGTVGYTWLRSDNATGPIKTITFTEAGTKTVTTSWTLGGSGQSYPNFWQQLKIVNPEEKLSNKAIFSLKCDPAGIANEDCLKFNNQKLSILSDNNIFTVTDGTSRMMTFRTRQKAQTAIDIIKYYKMDSHCFAVRPNPSLKYLKVGNDLPSGSFPGEDCIPIKDPNNLTIVKKSNNLYSIMDGNSVPFSAKSMEEAERIVEIIKHYKPRYTCYVERPNPGMIYLKK